MARKIDMSSLPKSNYRRRKLITSTCILQFSFIHPDYLASDPADREKLISFAVELFRVKNLIIH